MKNQIILLSAISLPAVAEVSDKMATIPELWFQGVVGAVILFLLARWYAWLAIFGVVVVAFFVVVSYETFEDPFVGVAILREQGTPYVVSSYGSAILMAIGTALGFVFNRRRKRHAT